MRIIISPAKKMRTDRDSLEPRGLPVFLPRAQKLAHWLGSLSLPQLAQLLACNDEIARLNFERYRDMDLSRGDSPAILSYDGIQYQYMAPQVFEDGYFDYIQEHLRILSGLYGVVRPLDGVVPYRLEMQARLNAPFASTLYDYWGEDLCREVIQGEDLLLDLASKEYSRAVRRHLPRDFPCVTCVFGQLVGDKVVEKGVYVKMARGEMVRFMAQRKVTRLEELREFDRLGFRWEPSLSDDRRLVFLMDKPPRPAR